MQVVDAIYDEAVARALGIDRLDQVTVMVHTGSRGLGYQVCDDSLDRMAADVLAVGEHLGSQIGRGAEDVVAGELHEGGVVGAVQEEQWVEDAVVLLEFRDRLLVTLPRVAVLHAGGGSEAWVGDPLLPFSKSFFAPIPCSTGREFCMCQ